MENINSEQLTQADEGFLSDFDFDQMSFSALDKGLGFHHKEKDLKENVVSSSTYELKSNKLRTSKSIKEISVPTLKNDSSLRVTPEISLEAALGVSDKGFSSETLAEGQIAEDEMAMIESSLEKVTAAWAVDLTLILLSIVSALILFMSSTGIGVEEFKDFLIKPEAQIFIGVFFTMFYLLYFSVLDLNSSPGKLLFGTKLVAVGNKRLTVFNTFIRSFIILVSIPLFLLPLIFGLHNKLSGTQSVEEKW